MNLSYDGANLQWPIRIRTPSPTTSFHANSCSVESIEDSATATCKHNDQVLLVWYFLSLVAIFAIWIQYSNVLFQHLPSTINTNREKKIAFNMSSSDRTINAMRRKIDGVIRQQILVSRQNTGCILHYWAAMLKYCQRSRGTPPRR